MHHVARRLDVVLEVRHEVRSVPLDLLVRTNGAEDNLGEAPALERPVRDAPDHLERLLDDGDGQVRSVVDEPRNVVLWHLGQLFLKDAFQPREDDEGFALVVVVHYAELNLASALLDDGGLLFAKQSAFLSQRHRSGTQSRVFTFSGNGIGFMAGFFSAGSADSSCLMRFEGVGDEGSSSALRFPSAVSSVHPSLSRNYREEN